jgi:hypothetical protein
MPGFPADSGVEPVQVMMNESSESVGPAGKLQAAEGVSKTDAPEFTTTMRVGGNAPDNNPLTFSGGKPSLSNDPFNPDLVNHRSAEFYSLYGDNPVRGTLSNADARKWYLQQEASIPSLLDTSQPLSAQARQAFS